MAGLNCWNHLLDQGMTVMNEYKGWLFDLYAHPAKGVVLWLVGEDEKRHSFHHDFEVVFYAGGPFPRLKEAWRFLQAKHVKLRRVTRDDLFDGPREVMEARVANPSAYTALFREVCRHFPDLTFYDADIPLPLRYAAAQNVFMMACCIATAQPDGRLTGIVTTDTSSGLDPRLPPLRKLTLKPDTDPSHAVPEYLLVKFNGFALRAPLNQPRDLLRILNDILMEYDPDVIQTHFGDTWIFPTLAEFSSQTGIPFNPNRDRSQPVLRRKEVSFFNYGRAHYRGPQTHLRGRWHIDVENCMTYGAYGLAGAMEQARMTGLPVQESARRSPGAGVAAAQTLTALRRKVLVPYQHQKGEIPKTYHQLVKADRGGLVFQPLQGLFANVAILDFSSMMASIMVEYNISPETVGVEEEGAFEIPELEIKVGARRGLMPETLEPMRDKRLALKRLLKSLDGNDPSLQAVRGRYKSMVEALKWLTVVAYGRLGYANSTFGRINAHEVVSFLARKLTSQAKAIAEDKGFTVLHLYVDSIFVSHPAASVEDFQSLAEDIARETRLPIEVEDVYSWFAFINSRQNPNLSVANRFYGLSRSGEYKIRGLALRRSDTPLFIANIQLDVLKVLAKENDPARLADHLPEILALLQERISALKKRDVLLSELVVTQTLSRELDQYSALSALSTAARQLQAYGKTIKMGQRVRYLYIGSGPGVHAWDLPTQPEPRAIDVPRYRELILRAVQEVLEPLGVSRDILRDWLLGKAGYIAQPGMLASSDPTRLALPLFRDLKYLHVDTL
jgi:DNA polymerase-2